MCTFYLMDGEKVYMNYKGKGTGGQGGTGTFVMEQENMNGIGNKVFQYFWNLVSSDKIFGW